MANLSTITLSELTVVTETGNSDYVLIENNGRMKKMSASEVGGGVYIIDITNGDSSGNSDSSGGGEIL